MSKRVSNKRGPRRKTLARSEPKFSKYDATFRAKRKFRRLTK